MVSRLSGNSLHIELPGRQHSDTIGLKNYNVATTRLPAKKGKSFHHDVIARGNSGRHCPCRNGKRSQQSAKTKDNQYDETKGRQATQCKQELAASAQHSLWRFRHWSSLCRLHRFSSAPLCQSLRQ